MIHSEWKNGSKDLAVVRALREAVFVDELGIGEELVFDGFDAWALHAVLYNAGEPVGTGRLYHDGEAFYIGRICVLKDRRGQGFGDMIARLLLDRAIIAGAPGIRVNVPPEHAGFYEQFGFSRLNGTCVEAGRPAVRMEVQAKDAVFPSKCGCG
jgi:hypothetical protein